MTTARRLIAASLVAAASLGTAGPGFAEEKRVPADRTEIRLSFAPVVKKVAPAVVNIRTKIAMQESPIFSDPFFRRFFGPNAPQRRRRQRGSLGSGVIVAADGLIVTNFHVIRRANVIQVILADKREFEAKVLLKDKRTDLAVLKIDPRGEKLPVLPIRDADELEVGDLVLAVGNPFGVGQTVTSGIVSALARTSIGITDYRFFIQTDAAINPGNSGGALVSIDGRLVGINTAIYSRSGGSIGIGFAIPSTMVRAVVAAAKKGGPLRRPWLGAEGQAVTSGMAESLGLKKVGGVIITKVHKGSPAHDGGLKIRDVILHVNGKEVINGEGLRFRLATLPIGGKATLTVVRAGKQTDVVIDLRAAPENPPRNEWVVRGQNPLSGAKVANLSPGYAEELGVRHTSGVIVTGIRRGSIAHRIGLRDGDIVLRINNSVIKTVGALRQAVGNDNYRWLISIRRGRQIITRQLVL